MNPQTELEHASPLGKNIPYCNQYDPNLLFRIPRAANRNALQIPTPLPFKGVDLWNGFEMAWLNPKGKPMVGIAAFSFPCTSPNHMESKSFKLYLHSFNQTTFESPQAVIDTLVRDLSNAAEAPVDVKLTLLENMSPAQLSHFDGICLDTLDITCNVYNTQPDFLTTKEGHIEETVYSNLLKSNCRVTGQPDWASIQIQYAGKPIDHAGLLKYIVSFRNQLEFHEQCVEHIFMDIMQRCHPRKLTVYARYTRRGGLDINPYRSTEDTFPDNIQLLRQ